MSKIQRHVKFKSSGVRVATMLLLFCERRTCYVLKKHVVLVAMETVMKIVSMGIMVTDRKNRTWVP